jgi:hypothetical protein
VANDPDFITVGANGSVYLGPVGTTMPTTIAASWDAAFSDVGYLNEDGVTIQRARSIEARRAWQSFFPVRRIATEMDLIVSFTMIEFKKSNVQTALEGTIATATGVHTFTPNDPEDIAEKALGVEWRDGAYTFRLTVPKVLSTEDIEFSLRRSEESGLPLTLGIIGTDAVQPYSIFTDHPAWA